MINKIAYVVVCWNNEKIIGECLESIIKQTYKDKVIYVIDNDSADKSVDYIKKNFPSVSLIQSDNNNGFAKGNNILINEALRDESVSHVALINSDAVIDTNWTCEITEFIKSKRHVASAQGVTLDYYDHDTIDAEHVYFGDNFQSVQYGYGEKFNEVHAYPRRVFGVNAAAAIYSRDFIEAQHNQQLFDEKFYMYLEDVDVCFRANIMGWNSFYIPSAEAYHMGSVSAKKRSNGYNLYMTFRNQSALIFKNMPFRIFIKFLPTALKFERHFYKHLKETQGKEISNLARRGRLVGILRIPLYIVDRIRVQSKRRITSDQLSRIMKNKGIF